MLEQAAWTEKFGPNSAWQFLDNAPGKYIRWGSIGPLALNKVKIDVLAHDPDVLVGFIADPHPLRNDGWVKPAATSKTVSLKRFCPEPIGHRIVVRPTWPFALGRWTSHVLDVPVDTNLLKSFNRLWAIHLWEHRQNNRVQDELVAYVKAEKPFALNYVARKGCTATCDRLFHVAF
eukprot:Trichotokara_eunicae@DN4455_c0_g1_i1.p1